jgi:23S rRNA pseudouridine1911/1915/1917 synthase
MEVIYEDNHIVVVSKRPGEIVQADKTGDKPLSEMVKEYIKEKYCKPGNVFCGVVHRIDRPAQGLVIFARTTKALTRLNEMLRKGEIKKTYRAIVEGKRARKEDTLTHYLRNDGRINKTFITKPSDPEGQKSVLKYKVIGEGERYSLLEINLLTGRKHQIRCQLSSTGTPIKGDLKYHSHRSNPDGGICLLAYHLEFIHPVSKKPIDLYAPLPELDSKLWNLDKEDTNQ